MSSPLNAVAVARAARDVKSQVDAVLKSTTLTVAQKSAALDRIEADQTGQRSDAANLARARSFAHMGEALPAGHVQSSGLFAKNQAPAVLPDADALAELHDALVSRKSFRVQLKAGATDFTGLLPSQLMPGIVAQRHEPARIMNHIPTGAMAGPSVEYLRHSGTTGSAATVAAGALKPAVTMNIDTVIARASKIAATTGVVDENLHDFPAFVTYVGDELTRLIIDAENFQLLNGDGTGTNVLGLRNLTGTLVRVLGTDTALDAVEQAITDLRTGPAFAEADVIVLNPTTFSKLRRTKDSQGRYLLNPDPAAAEANTLWSIPVVSTTTMPAGEALLMASDLAAMVHVRQGVTLEMSPNSGDDFVTNTTRFRAEERLALALPRPDAIIRVTGL